MGFAPDSLRVSVIPPRLRGGIAINRPHEISVQLSDSGSFSTLSSRRRRQPRRGGTLEGGPVDLVGRGQRQLVEEPDEARMLVGGRVRQRKAFDVLRIRPLARPGNDESERVLSLG